ncbi:MAG: CHASE3 domain-containing protein [Anaerolineae bacterium]|nr:CHASE3 domain-containing protein [Anaerolineae bacterium]
MTLPTDSDMNHSLSGSQTFQRTLIRAIVYPVVLLVLLIVIFLWQLANILGTNERVQHSNIVIGAASSVLNLIVDMETGLRGYLLTGDAVFLEPYRQAQTDFESSFAALQTLVSDNPSQIQHLQVVKTSIAEWQTFAERALADQTGEQEGVNVAAQLAGKSQMDTIREQLQAFVDTEDGLRAERIQTSQRVTLWVIASVVLGGLVVGSMLAWMIRRRLIGLSQTYEQALQLSHQQASEILSQQERLRQSNEQLQQFAYVASHDLQEPLRMIITYLQLLQKRYANQLDTDANDFIGFAVDGASRMKGLIAGLLQYSRLDTGDRKTYSLISLEDTLNATLSNLEVAITESNAVITCDKLPQLEADPLQMTQLLQNLIGNAIKFRGENPVKIHVGVVQRDKEWQFSISDNGIGIEPAYRERIFGMFQRLHDRAAYEGTGIGLAVCKKIVERHGGRIWVESNAEGGSSFFFTLPKRQARS